jgi:peptidylprolyl isomerase
VGSKIAVDNMVYPFTCPGTAAHPARTPKETVESRPVRHAHPRPSKTGTGGPARAISRHRLVRDGAILSLSSLLILSNPLGGEARAIGFKKDLSKARRNSGVSQDQYASLDISGHGVTETTTTTGEDGNQVTQERAVDSLRYYDVVPGTKSAPVAEGDEVTVHFDCIYRKIDAVSTRSARLLGENRVIAEPFSFVAGSQLDAPRAITTDAGGGLFSGQSGPKAPQAVSYAVVGMKVGGKRSVLVPAVLGYGSKGEQEIPPNCSQFELVIELLSVGGNDQP